MTDCARGCTLHGRHATACLCTPECAEHPNHCRGCLPRQADVGHYCQRCADKFRDALTELPKLVTTITQLPGGKLNRAAQGAGDTSRRPTKVDQQSPSPAWDTADEAIQWAAAWAWIIAGRPDYDPIKYTIAGLPLADITTAITHITNRLTQALTDDYHADLYNETITLHKRLTLVSGSDDLQHRLPEPCPTCGHRTLVRDDGAKRVVCRNSGCRDSWDEDHYAYLARVAAS